MIVKRQIVALKESVKILLLENHFKNGTMSSFAIAWNSQGDPARHCKAAPIEDRKIPIVTSHLVGQAISATKILSKFYKSLLFPHVTKIKLNK